MTALDWKNADRGLCVVDGKKVEEPGAFFCRNCGKPCEVTLPPLGSEAVPFITYDAKSKCCNADIFNQRKITCSDLCHEKLVQELEKEFGAYKKVADINTGLEYRVPTRDIIEKGLTYADLQRYPLWAWGE